MPPAPPNPIRRIALILMLPLMLAALGVWQYERGVETAAEMAREASATQRSADRLAPLAAARPMEIIHFKDSDRAYSAELALKMLRDAVAWHGYDALVAGTRGGMAIAAILGGAVAALAGAIGLLAASGLARRASGSRADLVARFSTLRRRLPALLGFQVGGLCIAIFGAVVFEAAGAWYWQSLDGNELKLLAGAVVLGGAALWFGWVTLRRLRRALRAFTPPPTNILGREVGPAAAPALHAFIEGLVEAQHALAPDHVVVGLGEGFFVTANTVRLGPEDRMLEGRTLYLPAPYLAMLDEGEVAAIVSHELAHFSGEDTIYSQRFLPIYDGMSRSLRAVSHGSDQVGNWLLNPAATLGLHLLETFDIAVNHWSRVRELAADAATPSASAAGSALIRTGAIARVVDRVFDHLQKHPEDAPPDLVVEMVAESGRFGLAAPDDHLEERQPHPTDTHPPTRARLTALSVAVDDALLTRASRPVGAAESGFATQMVTDWPGLCGTLSAEITALALRNKREMVAELEAYAAKPDNTPREIFETVRRGLAYYGLIAVGCLALGGLIAWVLMFGHTAEPDAVWWLTLLSVALVLVGLAAAVAMMRRMVSSRTPFLVLRPASLTCRGLDRDVPWDEVESVSMSVGNGNATTLKLRPGAVLPRRVAGWRTRVVARKRAIVLIGMLPRGLTRQEYVDLIGSYIAAAQARALLAQQTDRETRPA